jgi:pimeloyl-ACP methyl ester carboxylesterase
VIRVQKRAIALARNGVFRPGADDTYADGDDSAWMEVDWPSMTRCLRVSGRDVNVVDMGGDGPPLLFVHGLGGAWQNWLLNMPAFADSHRVVALDLPGFGDSDMPADPDDLSILGFAKVVDAVCDQLGIDCPVVVGNSMGGFVGAELALSYPTRVDKLVLVSAAGLSTEYLQREPLVALARLWAAVTTRAGARSEPVVKRPRLRRVFLQTVVLHPERLSVPLTAELVKGAGRPGFVPALSSMIGYSFRERLPQIEMPVLIVWGRQDLLVPVNDAERFERLIGENAHKVIFEDTGHLAMLERPSRFNELLASFIAGEREPEAGITGISLV